MRPEQFPENQPVRKRSACRDPGPALSLEKLRVQCDFIYGGAGKHTGRVLRVRAHRRGGAALMPEDTQQFLR